MKFIGTMVNGDDDNGEKNSKDQLTVTNFSAVFERRQTVRGSDFLDDLGLPGHATERASVHAMVLSSPPSSMFMRADSINIRDLPKLAKNPPPPPSSGQKPNPKYIQLRSFVFSRQIWSGYEHRMTKGERAHGHGKTGEGGEDRTWEFCLRD